MLPSDSGRPFQFGIRHALGATLSLAVGLAIVIPWGPGGIPIATVAIVSAWWICLTKPGWHWLLPLGACVLFFGLAPWYSKAGPHAHAANCGNNLRQIALAIQCYEQTYGCYPPAYIADGQGQPMHSWRVLILPFLEEKALYAEYRFDEPWNGVHNRQLATRMPPVFRCFADRSGRTMTNYVAVVGPETIWPGSRSALQVEVTDPLSRTLMIVETGPATVPWMEPRDLELARLSLQINSARGGAISSRHIFEPSWGWSRPAGAWGVTADGQALWLPNTLKPEVLRALLTKAGSENVTVDLPGI